MLSNNYNWSTPVIAVLALLALAVLFGLALDDRDIFGFSDRHSTPTKIPSVTPAATVDAAAPVETATPIVAPDPRPTTPAAGPTIIGLGSVIILMLIGLISGLAVGILLTRPTIYTW